MADLNTALVPDAVLIASNLRGIRRRSILPGNWADFPLGNGQRYGQSATNCRVCLSKAGTNRGVFSRSHHRARGAISEIAVVVQNWYVDRAGGKLEIPSDGDLQITMSVEYPAGTFYQLKFEGSPRERVAAGDFLVSDFRSIAIPDDAEFWTNMWMQAPTGNTIVFFAGDTGQGQVAANGEKLSVGATSATDSTMATSAATAQATGWWPTAIISRTSNKSAIIVKDSIGEGVSDTADTTDAIGSIARSIVGGAAYINLSQRGDRLELALQSSARRLALLPLSQNGICGLGVNDIGAGRSLSQIKADMITRWTEVKALLAGSKRVFQTTITPSVITTDAYATLANQTPATNFSTAGNGTRELLNDWLRDGAPINAGSAVAIGDNSVGTIRAGIMGHPLYSVLELADVVESSRNSGKWKVDGTANKWTADGIHPSTYAYAQIAASGYLTVAMLA